MLNKVFGIGLSHTGTKSLDSALNILGIKSMHYPIEQNTMQLLASGCFELPILEEYDGLTDVQAVPFYPQLDETYPGSKFILTVRDVDEWIASTKKNMRTKRQMKFRIRVGEFKQVDWLRAAVYGTVAWNESVYRRRYKTHYDDVLNYFKDRPNDLLVMNIIEGQGWETLCPFLGKEIPRKRRFPTPRRSNKAAKSVKRKEMKR